MVIVVYYSKWFKFFNIIGGDASLIQHHKITCGFRSNNILIYNNQWFYSFLTRDWVYLL